MNVLFTRQLIVTSKTKITGLTRPWNSPKAYPSAPIYCWTVIKHCILSCGFDLPPPNMNSLLIIACHLALAFAAPQSPASQYGPPNYSGQVLLSAPAPAPVPFSYPAVQYAVPAAAAPLSQYPVAPSPYTQYPAAPAPAQYPAAPAPVQYPAAPAPVQYPAAPAPAQYPAAPAPVQYPAAPAPAQYPTAPAPAQYPTAPLAPAQYPATAQSPTQFPVAAPAAPASFPPAAPAPYTFPASAPHSGYSAPGQAPLSTGGELLSAPAPATPGGVPEEIVLPQNSRLEIRDNQGQYSHGFSDDKGTQISEQGSLITTNGGWEYVIAKKGSYSYTSPEGKKVSVSYIADHNGYRILDQSVE